MTRRRSLGLRYHLNRTVLIMRNRSVQIPDAPAGLSRGLQSDLVPGHTDGHIEF